MKSFLSLLSGFVMIVGMVGAAGAGDQDAAIRAGGWTTLLLQFAMIGENLFGRDSSARWPLAGWKESFEETLARLAFLVLLLAGFAALLLALIMVAREAYPALFARGGLWGLLIADSWEPLSQPARLGVRHAWLSTLTITSIALAVAAPLGFAIGIFIAEIAPPAIKKMLQPCLELLAGIPSVVYGFFGYVTLVPWFESAFEMATGESLLAAGHAFGSAAPVLLTASVVIARSGLDLSSPVMTLPSHLYYLVSEASSLDQAYATALILVALLLTANFSVMVIRSWQERWSSR